MAKGATVAATATLEPIIADSSIQVKMVPTPTPPGI